MKQLLYIASLSLLMTGVSLDASAQSKGKKTKVVTVHGKAAEASRGANPIRTERPTTDEGREKSRGSACTVYFDNYTSLYIDVYMDGDYYGTVSPWGASTFSVGSGYTTIYCKSAGGTREWSAAGDCRETYRYKLD